LSSNPVHRPSRLEEDFKSQQKLEFDRWQTAVTIVKRLREAGISCELFDDFKNVHWPLAHCCRFQCGQRAIWNCTYADHRSTNHPMTSRNDRDYAPRQLALFVAAAIVLLVFGRAFVQ